MSPRQASCSGLLDDKWFYEELRVFRLTDWFDLRPWYQHSDGPRWRNMSHRPWTSHKNRSEWRKLLSRLPAYFAAELAFLMDKNLEAARYLLPQFDTILANHAYFEWLLYMELDFDNYREHVVHPFKVAMVARWLLNNVKNCRRKVKDRLKASEHVRRLLAHLRLTTRVFDSDDGDRIVKAALWLASQYHDLGYGYQFALGLERRLQVSYGFYRGDLLGGSIAGTHPDLIERSLLKRWLEPKSGARSVENGSRQRPVATGTWRDIRFPPAKEPWQVSLYRNMPLNHSLAGALNLLCLLQEIVDHWPEVDPRFVLVFELAAEAIFLHDLTKKSNWHDKELKITFKDCPIAVLLVLSDEIQSWGRPRLRYRSDPNTDEVTVQFRSEPDDGVRYHWEHTRDTSILELEGEVFKNISNLKRTQKRLDWTGLLKLESMDRRRLG
jgi:hypothetical protein